MFGAKDEAGRLPWRLIPLTVLSEIPPARAAYPVVCRTIPWSGTVAPLPGTRADIATQRVARQSRPAIQRGQRVAGASIPIPGQGSRPGVAPFPSSRFGRLVAGIFAGQDPVRLPAIPEPNPKQGQSTPERMRLEHGQAKGRATAFPMQHVMGAAEALVGRHEAAIGANQANAHPIQWTTECHVAGDRECRCVVDHATFHPRTDSQCLRPANAWRRKQATSAPYPAPSNEARAARNSSTAPASVPHSASPTGRHNVIIPRRASHIPAASISKKKSSFSF